MSVDYDQQADDYAKLRPAAYARCCELFERYDWQAITHVLRWAYRYISLGIHAVLVS